MIKIFKSCFLLLLLTVSYVSYSQDVSIQISIDSVFAGTGSSSGARTMQFRGYSLQSVVARIFDVQKNVIRIEESLMKKTVSVKIETKDNIWQTDLKPAFKKALKDKLGVLIEIKTEQTPVWVAYLPNDEAINKNKCLSDGNGVSKSISQNLSEWTATCGTTQDLISVISEWSNKIIINETMTKDPYNFLVKRKSWTDLVNDLDFNYGIVLTEETRNVEIVMLHQ